MTGLGFMITTDMLPFLYQKWRQPKTIEKLQVAQNQSQPKTTTPSKTTKAMIDINQEEETSTDNGSNPQVEEISSNCTLKLEDKKEEDSQDEEEQSRNSISTEEKDCEKPTSFKPSYLNTVLKGKFNSFHILGEHRENIMRKG